MCIKYTQHHIFIQIKLIQDVYSTWLDLNHTIELARIVLGMSEYESIVIYLPPPRSPLSTFHVSPCAMVKCYLSNGIRIFTSCIEMNKEVTQKNAAHRFNLKALRTVCISFCTSKIMTATYAVFRKMATILYLLLLLLRCTMFLKEQNHLHS